MNNNAFNVGSGSPEGVGLGVNVILGVIEIDGVGVLLGVIELLGVCVTDGVVVLDGV